jgi:hypothetical protein
MSSLQGLRGTAEGLRITAAHTRATSRTRAEEGIPGNTKEAEMTTTTRYREWLVEALESSAAWRRDVDSRFPDDPRNANCANALLEAADVVRQFSDNHPAFEAMAEIDREASEAGTDFFSQEGSGRSSFAGRYGFEQDLTPVTEESVNRLVREVVKEQEHELRETLAWRAIEDEEGIEHILALEDRDGHGYDARLIAVEIATAETRYGDFVAIYATEDGKVFLYDSGRLRLEQLPPRETEETLRNWLDPAAYAQAAERLGLDPVVNIN